MLHSLSRSTAALFWTACAFVLILSPVDRARAESPVPAAEAAPQVVGTAMLPRLLNGDRGASSSSTAKQAAMAELPLDKVGPNQQRQIRDVLSSVSLFRRMPTLTFEVDPDVYLYFTKNPDVVVSIWHAMEISKFQLQAADETRYEADAGDGSKGTVHVLFRDAEQTLVLCDGVYTSPLLVRPIQARALLHLQTGFLREADGRTFAVHRSALFVSLPSQTVEAAARLISPISNLIADRNFKQITTFVQMMNLAMCRQPGWVEGVAYKMDIPEEKRSEFLKLAAHAYVVVRKRELAAGGDSDVTLDEILDPLRTAVAEPLPASDAIPPSPRLTEAPGAGTSRK